MLAAALADIEYRDPFLLTVLAGAYWLYCLVAHLLCSSLVLCIAFLSSDPGDSLSPCLLPCLTNLNLSLSHLALLSPPLLRTQSAHNSNRHYHR